MFNHLRIAIAATVIAVRSLPATADSTGARAEALFREGRELLTAGKLVEACAAFDTSDQLEHAVTTLINRADCRERHGELATAWGYFVDAERQTRNATDPEISGYHKLAAARAQLLEPRLSRLTVSVPDGVQVAELAITRGSGELAVGEWGRAVPVDGGSYTIHASAPGYESWSTTIEVSAERDVKTVVVPALRRKPSWARANLGGLMVGAGSLTAIGGAVAFELLGESAATRSQTAPVAQRISLWTTANRDRHIAEGLGVVGVAGVGVAAWLWFRHHDEDHDPALARRGDVEVDPLLTGGSAGVQVLGRF